MKSKKVIIFGVSDFAKLIKHYFDIDSKYKIVAFCIDDKYQKDDTFCGLPVIKYSEINKYSPNEYSFFIAIGYSKLNSIRAEVYTRLKKLGYSFVNYISLLFFNYNNQYWNSSGNIPVCFYFYDFKYFAFNI